jgi:signal transduction histidine kinase
MIPSRSSWSIAAAWTFFVGAGAVVWLLLPPGLLRSGCGDVLLCLVPLFANACLLWNSATPYRRTNTFWMLLATGCAMWLIGQLLWTYYDQVRHVPFQNPTFADLIFFFHTVPWMAALALQPHERKMGATLRYASLDLILLGWLWLCVYAFFALPWYVASPDLRLYNLRNFQTYMAANIVVLVGLAAWFLRTRGTWRSVYGHLFGAAATSTAAFVLANMLSWRGKYGTGGAHDLLFIVSFVWFGTTGILAHRVQPSPDPIDPALHRDTQWPARLAMLGVLSAPLVVAWTAFASEAPRPVRQFRLLVTLAALLVGAALVFLRQQFVDREQLKLVRELQDSVANMKRLQTQLVHSEKLASLGQLAAGAAHEINNPLTAILGYSDMLIEEGTASERSRSLGEKIREQARRTKDLVTNLLSFARQVPAEKQLLDLNTVLTGAVQLRTLDLRDKNIRIDMKNPTVLPAVRGDPNQLLQVIYHIISNAVDAMEAVGGGVLAIRAMRERSNVVVEFSDSGPGIREPEKVFDPFYTTKPVGKGTGLGLSICYGILQEHGGQISCSNRPEGGCTFRIELPAVLALFPQSQPLPPVSTTAR